MLKVGHTKIAKSFTLEQRIQEVAAYATITPMAIKLLDKFFQDIATSVEKNEIDAWINSCAANELLFDLLLQFDCKQTKIAIIPRLRSLLTQADTGAFPV